MSLTATLLLKKPIRLPVGQVRTHSMDTHRKWERSTAQQQCSSRNRSIRQGNVERIYQAVADGDETALDITITTELSISTVNKALHDLEDWPGGARVIRTKNAIQHRFHVVPT